MNINEIVRHMNACLLEINENGLLIRQYARIKSDLEKEKKVSKIQEKKLYQIMSETQKVSARLKENSNELSNKTKSEKFSARELKNERIQLLDKQRELTLTWKKEYRQMKQSTNIITNLYLELKNHECTPKLISSYIQAIDDYNYWLNLLNDQIGTTLAPLPRSVYKSVNQRFPFKLVIQNLEVCEK